MFTCCPQCQTVFSITAHQISMAHGYVRCGRCGEVYSAVDHLADELDDEGDLPPSFHSDRPPTLTQSELENDSLEDDLFLSRDPAPIDLGEEEPELESLDEDEEAMAVLAPPADTGVDRAGWVLGVLILIAALGGQYVWVERDDLVQNERWRPWLEQACEMSGCTLPFQKDLAQIQLVSRDIRPHPSVSSSLIISATMQNRAAFTQPHPQVEIVLSDLNGQRIAMRRFLPEQYLDDAAQLRRGIPPGTLLPLVFEVVDPGQNAVAFEFSFR